MIDAPPPPPELTLVELLELKAREEGLTNFELCQRIGLDHGLWSRVRRGLESFGVNTCARIVERCPEFEPAAARYLRGRYDARQLALLVAAGRLDPSGE
jgi:hypothetical protein